MGYNWLVALPDIKRFFTPPAIAGEILPPDPKHLPPLLESTRYNVGEIEVIITRRIRNSRGYIHLAPLDVRRGVLNRTAVSYTGDVTLTIEKLAVSPKDRIVVKGPIVIKEGSATNKNSIKLKKGARMERFSPLDAG